MKKKILFGAVIAALALVIVACKQVGDIKWDNKGSGTGSKIVKVKQTNDKDHTIRGMYQLDAFKRGKATCIVEQYDQTDSSNDGMVGFITFYSENNKDKEAENYGTMNFLVVGVKNNCGKTQTYASYYCNIHKDQLSTENFGVGSNTKSAYDENETEPYEVVIVDLPGANTPGVSKIGNINNVKYDKTSGTLKMAIEFTGKKDGSIEIKWYSDWNETAASQAAAQIDFDGKSPVYSAVASAEQIGNEVDETDPTDKAKKGNVFAYANIYYDKAAKKGKTLNAKWQLCNVSLFTAANAEEEGELLEVGDIFFQEF